MKITVFIVALIAFFSVQKADACTRIVYTGDTTETAGANTLRIVGRSLDWSTPIPTNIYVYPRGMKKKSNDKGKTIDWTSKYGAVYAVGYDSGITEGMNEKGLTVNGLFCRGTIYNGPEQEGKPMMSLSVIVAWLLDNYATTQEVIDAVKDQNFFITAATFDGGQMPTLHFGITDESGLTAILEFQNGKLDVYQGYDLPVLTNDPAFPAMQAINTYWEGVGGQNFLPGAVRSSDRFTRGTFFVNHTERTNDRAEGLAVVRSILNNCSVPFKYALGDKNLSQTQWRSFSNISDRRYYFETVTDLGLYYVDLKECNLAPGAPVLFFDTSKASTAIGDITLQMTPHAPFTPMF